MGENENTSSAVDRLTYLLIGAGIGATIALLFAPKSGRELRGDIADVSRRGIDYTTEKARTIGEKAHEAYDSTAAKAHDLIETGKETVAAKREAFQAAIDAGKEAYAEEKGRKSIGTGASTSGDA